MSAAVAVVVLLCEAQFSHQFSHSGFLILEFGVLALVLLLLMVDAKVMANSVCE